MQIINDGVSSIYFPFSFRPHQKKILEDLGRFNIVVCHRRFGKTVMMMLHLFLSALMVKKKNPIVWYVCPQFDQAVNNGWQYLKDYASFIPGAKIYETENKIQMNLNDGYGVRTVAIKGATGAGANLRGAYLDGVVLDEMGTMPSGVWEDVIRPMLADRLGWAVLTGTPMTGYFHQFYKKQIQLNEEGEGEFNIFNYTVYDSGVIPEEEIVSLKKTMDKGKFAREFLNEWIAPDIGSYYSKYLFELKEQGLIKDTVATYQPNLPVITAWDLGRNDYTCVWFIQIVDGKFNFIDFLQVRGKLDKDILNEVLSKNYNISTILLPHDSVHKHISAENSTYTKFRKLLPNVNVRVVPKATPQAGIDSVLTMIKDFRFNSLKCSIGLEALHAYKSELKEKHGVLSTQPIHDWSSHAADALRTFAVGWQGVRYNHGLTNNNKNDITVRESYDPI